MQKSKKILLYGILGSILYIILCVYLHINRVNKTKISSISIDKSKKNQNLEKKLTNKNINKDINLNSDKNSTLSNSSLEYKIENGVITIAGNMPILDDEDSLKKTMMRFCSEEYCDRTIVFSSDREMPFWKEFAKDIINFFYDYNLTNASFEVDEYNNISISGELLTQEAKDKIAQIIKNSNISNINNNTHLKVMSNRVEDKKDINIIDTILNNNTTTNKSNNIASISDKNSSDDTITIAENRIQELLSTKKINFYRNRARITRDGKMVLNEIIEIIKDMPNIKIEVKGYTDASGKRAINKWISQERAKSVKRYLGRHGISLEDIEAEGFGEDDLLYPDKPYSPLNRRVEIDIKRK